MLVTYNVILSLVFGTIACFVTDEKDKAHWRWLCLYSIGMAIFNKVG